MGRRFALFGKTSSVRESHEIDDLFSSLSAILGSVGLDFAACFLHAFNWITRIPSAKRQSSLAIEAEGVSITHMTRSEG